MRYEYCPSDLTRYATNLRKVDTGQLQWDSAPGQDVLIIQTPYGEDPTEKIDDILKTFDTAEPKHDKFTEVMNGVWVRCVTAVEKAKQGGCPLNGEASTYTVFSYIQEEDVCKILAPCNQSLASASCNLSVEINIYIRQVTRRGGFLIKRETPTGFYCVTFPVWFGNGYVDGDLCYQFDNIEIPITREMLERNKIYIKTDNMMEWKSYNKGLNFSIRYN
jgi:hypothetical protein